MLVGKLVHKHKGKFMQSLYKKSSFTESFWGWLKREEASSKFEDSQLQFLGVHSQLIDTLEQGGVSYESELMHRLVNATELQDLWYARSEMMLVLCKLHGEAAAWRIMQDITPMFEGILSPSLFKRAYAPRKATPELWPH